MINQISPVKTQTQPLPAINKSLLQARHVQAHVKTRYTGGVVTPDGAFWTPITAGPFLVPVTRWTE